MQIFGSSELVADVQQKGLCVGCGGCVDICPYFRNHRGKTAQLFSCTLPQGRCHAFCPKTEVDLAEIAEQVMGAAYDGSPLGHCLRVTTARAGEKAVRGRSQAGGTVTALVAFALETGLIDAAALTDRTDAIAVPRLVTSPEDVVACAGSKFMTAPSLAAFHKGAAEGLKMGVVGTPCQVTSLAQMRLNPLEREDFRDAAALVIGLFCTWALDTRLLMPLLAECVGDACVLGMDLPPPPSEIMVIDTGEDKVQIPLERIRPLIPQGCHICPDMTSEFADISVGVMEGRPDLNTLIVRTARGAELVDRARESGVLVTGEMPAANLAHLSAAAAGKKQRALVRAREAELLNTTAEGKRAAMRMPEDVANRLTASQPDA